MSPVERCSAKSKNGTVSRCVYGTGHTGNHRYEIPTTPKPKKPAPPYVPEPDPFVEGIRNRDREEPPAPPAVSPRRMTDEEWDAASTLTICGPMRIPPPLC